MAFIPTKKMSFNLPSVFNNFNQMLDAWQRQPSSSQDSPEGLWHPLMNIYDHSEEIIVELELPGMNPEAVDISIEEDHLYVEGRRTYNNEYGEENCYYSERSLGDFHRIIHLQTSVDPENVKAKYRDGILTINLPKQERLKGKRIKIME